MTPRPVTREAMLWSEKAGWFTLHFYVETRPCTVRDGAAWEHIYECIRTGERRRWGCDQREELN